ncbi:hypothetical protein [Agromyces sp. NBRC 114283]|uniref:hypothetical protein n=1 Tax=Agromyces sp. NBRC 114283 TaxID=2994521 RepID=UPI0024A2B273|nr:hypothetical protein [Agromyces sp. NBRC 114283]GLU91296.1 hypothetical protein Agsp01_35510 [Agromyces sp. NBRC 114283]
MELVGFVADLAGIDGQIFEAAPSVVLTPDARETLVAPGLGWAPESLVPLAGGANDYVHFLGARDRVELAPGETVWLAGESFVAGVRHCAAVLEQAYELRAWSTASRGIRWAKGTRQEFHDLVHGLAVGLQGALHRSLFDSLEMSHGDADTIYALYTGLPLKPTRASMLNRGLYFAERRDRYSYEFVRSEAIIVHQLFASEFEFDQAVDELRVWLRGQRLAEQAPVRDAEKPFAPRRDYSEAMRLFIERVLASEQTRSPRVADFTERARMYDR